MKISVQEFVSLVPQEDLEDCITSCVTDILYILKNHYSSSLLMNLPEKLPKNKIMNFDIIDYLKYHIITNELLTMKNSIIPCGKLLYKTKTNKVVSTQPSTNDWIKLLIPYHLKIYNEFKDVYRFINNQIIADYFSKLNDTHDLLTINDKIGDTIQLSSNTYVDVGQREQLFVFINDKWLIANDDDAYHSELIAEYLENITGNGNYYEISGQKIYTVNDIPTTGNTDDVAKEIESKPLFFGSIQGEIGYLASAKNINKKTAAEMIKTKFNVKKVYFQNQLQYKYTRLANLII